MRMAIGLAGILVTMGVIIWIMSAITLPSAKQAIDVKKKVTPQAEQWAGHTTNGTRAVDTMQVKAEHASGGRMTGVVVTDVVEGGAMETYFGLKKGDVITQIGPLQVSDHSDAATAKDFVVDQYQRSGTITVRRDGKEIKLPLPASAKIAATPAATPGTPAAPAAGDSSGDSVQKQLEAIPGVPR
jgi:S1-C subfamily serine protease